MKKIDSFIVKENSAFYFDFESYNDSNTDLPLEIGDVVKFTHDNQSYIGKLIGNFSNNGLMLIKLIK
jgi:hypothetical protein